MQNSHDVLLLLSGILALVYIVFVQHLLRGWKAFVSGNSKPENPKIKGISIVIACRNEACNLPKLFASFEKITYPIEAFEVIFVDDHSTDDSATQIATWCSRTTLDVKLFNGDDAGKKAAQAQGVTLAKFDVVAFTDADSVVPSNWLLSINQVFANEKTGLAFGAVGVQSGANVLQRIEFLSLIASTLAALKLGWPIMGNGANMACKKSEYISAIADLHSAQTPSGDDVFLLQALAARGHKIEVIGTPDIVVQTKPVDSLAAFVQQRLRWASKARFVTSKIAIGIGLLVFVSNAMLLVSFVLAIFSIISIWPFLLLFVAKTIADFVLLSRAANTFKQPLPLASFVLLEFLNLIYVPGIAIASQIVGFSWKGRSYK